MSMQANPRPLRGILPQHRPEHGLAPQLRRQVCSQARPRHLLDKRQLRRETKSPCSGEVGANPLSHPGTQGGRKRLLSRRRSSPACASCSRLCGSWRFRSRGIRWRRTTRTSCWRSCGGFWWTRGCAPPPPSPSPTAPSALQSRHPTPAAPQAPPRPQSPAVAATPTRPDGPGIAFSASAS